MKKLAIHGGEKTIKIPFPSYKSIGKEEVSAGKAVLESGRLSGFYGSWNDRFFGGPKVKELEARWAEQFEVKHAISFNSWTSGLIAAVGAIGIEPGDEVIVSPWTMSASATAILVWNAIPVFADIEDETFNLDTESVKGRITNRTKAIMVPDIFGHAANLDEIMDIASQYGLKVIEDAAQSPFARYKNKLVGTIADIGGYSLNYHKHIQTGEGGVAVTNNSELAERMQMIRNHAEAVAGATPDINLTNMVGFNFRLGEIEAAIAIEQLKKLDRLTEMRSKTGARLNEGLRDLKGLKTPVVRDQCSHVYYIYSLLIDSNKTAVPRERIVDALQAEGVPWIYPGYQLIHLLPIYQKKIAFGSQGFPWTLNEPESEVNYDEGICPVAERLHKSEQVCLQICQHNYTDQESNLVVEAFHKVWENLDELAE
jgi:perosamine synthetase